MSTFLVRKDGSGTHTTIQSAVYAAVNGDIIDIGQGTFYENVELLGKSLTVQGAGKDKTIIQGKFANDVITGCSYYGGESVITMPSTAAIIAGKSISGVTANTRVTAILSSTQIQTSLATSTTGNITKTGVTWSSGSSTITLPSATSVVVGMKVEGTGVNAIVTAYNSTTRVVTLSSPTTASGSAASLLFRKANTGVTITQVTNPNASSGPATIMVTGISNGLVIKNLWAIGFDGAVGQEAAALFFTAGTSPGHTNFLIDNCRLTADGDSAVMCGSNPYLANGTFQNCLIDGKTFTGSEPADVPSFSTYSSSAVVKSILATTSVITFSDMRGIIVGRTCTSTAFTGSASVTAINGNDVTINKVVSSSVGSTISCTFTLTAYSVPNCARNLFYVGQNISPNNTQNITFKNNTVKGQTGAVIASSGSRSMFNSAVTIESVGGLVENNVIDGIFGAGDPNPLAANWAIRCRQSGMTVTNNTNLVSGGRQNSGFMVLTDYGQNLGTNISVSQNLVSNEQVSSGQPVKFKMSKDLVKQIAKVQSSLVFSVESNWKLVSYVFKKTNSSQRIVSSFRDFSAEKAYGLKPSMVSGDQFELVKIIISTTDRQLLVIKRSELDLPSSYDFTLK